MKAQPEVIRKWVQERRIGLVSTLEKWDLPVSVDKVDAAIAKDLTRLNRILEHGLDVGTVVKRVVPVVLVMSEIHGWCFQRDSGELFPVGDQLRRMA